MIKLKHKHTRRNLKHKNIITFKISLLIDIIKNALKLDSNNLINLYNKSIEEKQKQQATQTIKGLKLYNIDTPENIQELQNYLNTNKM